MARTTEEGIEYFPLNSDIIHNSKIKLIVAQHGPASLSVIIALFCKIYKERGYWFDWLNEEQKELFCLDICKMPVEDVEKIVQAAIKRSIFDKEKFDLFGILTSKRIQYNFLVAKRRVNAVPFLEVFSCVNKKGLSVYKEFDNVNIIPLSVGTIVKSVDISTQNKNKKQIQEGEGDNGRKPKNTKEEIDLFTKFNEWIKTNTPRVNQLKEPLTIAQYLKLRKDIPKETFTKILWAMQNKADLLKKYISANLTIRNWANREKKEIGGGAGSQPAVKGSLSEAVKAIEEKNG